MIDGPEQRTAFYQEQSEKRRRELDILEDEADDDFYNDELGESK